MCRVSFQRDTKVANAATFEIQREDHTVGEALVGKLHDDETVAFAACKVPHPLEYRLQVKVKTNSTSNPIAAYNNAVGNLTEQLQQLKLTFQQQVQEMCESDPHLDFNPELRYEQTRAMADQGYDDEYGAAGVAFDDDLAFDTGFGAAS
jgi:DNA-directed RNA polymerase II subunit RPB11